MCQDITILTSLVCIDPGMRRSDLVMWYLEQREADISEEELDYENLLINKIIKKLLKTVSIFLHCIESFKANTIC
jgi:hypothetical protein